MVAPFNQCVSSMRSNAKASAAMFIVTERRRSILRNRSLSLGAVATMLIVGVLSRFTGYPVVSSARSDPGGWLR